MLVLWEYYLKPEDQVFLQGIDPRVNFWPAAWYKGLGIYNHAVPIEWWISFSLSQAGLVWCMKYPQFTRVIYPE